MMNHLDLFSGIGGFARAAQLAGLTFDKTFFSEINVYANKVYQKNYPGSIALGDIRSIKGEELRNNNPGAWLVTGGFPCTDISTAGAHNYGINGERTGLWWEMYRVVSELRPDLIIIENVPALLYSGLERVLFPLAKIGYDAEWEVISAASVGAPHLRKRIWIVAYPSSDLWETERLPVAEWLNMGDRGKSGIQNQSPSAWTDWETIITTRQIHNQPIAIRMDDGVSHQLDRRCARLRVCGNAIVPQVAESIFRRIQDNWGK